MMGNLQLAAVAEPATVADRAALSDKGVYRASASSFCRALKRHRQLS
ncbi:hypothetical protein [Allohahella marinimesophila]